MSNGITKGPTTFGTTLTPDLAAEEGPKLGPEPKRGLPPAAIGLLVGLGTALAWAGLGVWLDVQQTHKRKAHSDACKVCTITTDYIACMDQDWTQLIIERVCGEKR